MTAAFLPAGSSRRRHVVSAVRVGKRYGTTVALHDVSLEIGAGQFVTLLGPSGSGKTTLLMTIAGFVEPDGGEIRVDGQDITALRPERRNFGMVFQGYALFPHLSVADNVAFPLRLRKVGRAEREERVRRTLDLVQLGALASRMPRQLSGGQQQRVALARALVFEPDVLLLDEPLSALDKRLRADLQWELKDIHRRLGMTFVCVTHDQDEALSMSDRVAILRSGRVVQEGRPIDLYERPETRFVADFLGRSNFLTGRVRSFDGGEAVVEAGKASFRQSVAARPTPGAEVIVALRPEKIRLSTDAALDGTAPGTNVLAGTLLDWNYLGAAMHCRVATEAGPLFAVLPTWKSSLGPRPDLPVSLHWDVDAGHVVRAG